MPVPKQAVRRSRRSDSFTLVELLAVMAIIAILVALVLSAAGALINKAARVRAATEIQAMSTANESFKADNGIYPQSDGILVTNAIGNTYNASAYDGTTTEYQTNSTLLFIALSGQTNFSTPPVVGTKVYMSFKLTQVGNPTAAYSYIKDPWNMSYAYSTGTTNGATTPSYPYNGNGFFDLWSTAGITYQKYGSNNSLTNAWISNWTQ